MIGMKALHFIDFGILGSSTPFQIIHSDRLSKRPRNNNSVINQGLTNYVLFLSYLLKLTQILHVNQITA